MPNLPLNEDALVRRLKEVELPSAPPRLIQRLQEHPHRRYSALLWAIPATAATMLTVILIPALIAPPALSLAQVARAQSEHLQYTIKNTRIMNRGSESFSITMYRDGNLWRRGNLYGFPDRSVQIYNRKPYWNFVVFDGPLSPPQEEFRVDKLLREGETPKVERNILWHGRRVDRFTIRTTYRAGKDQTFDQEVIADPTTHLPIYMKIMRDSYQWGDEWHYDFSKPSGSNFKFTIPEGARRYDNREIRGQLESTLSSGPVGAILIDESHRVILFLDAKQAGPAPREITLESKALPAPMKGRFEEILLVQQRGRRVTNGTMKVAGRQWRLASFFLAYPNWSKSQKLYDMSTLDGRITLGGKSQIFKDVPVVKAGDGISVLRNYALE